MKVADYSVFSVADLYLFRLLVLGFYDGGLEMVVSKS